MVKRYIPSQGDICYIDLDPTIGHEQSGKRPAVVVSSKAFSCKTNMAILCPISTKNHSFPLHYELQNTKKVHGYVLCEHIRAVDFSARTLSYVETLQPLEFNEIFGTVFCEIEFDMNTIK